MYGTSISHVVSRKKLSATSCPLLYKKHAVVNLPGCPKLTPSPNLPPAIAIAIAIARARAAAAATAAAALVATEMILGFASRYACLGDLDKWAASKLRMACK